MKLLYLLVTYLKSASWLWGATDNVSRFFVCENFVSNEWNTWNRNRGAFTADFPLIHFGCCRIWRSFTQTGISWGVLRGYKRCLKIFWWTKISSTTSETHGIEIWFWCGFPVMAEITHRHTFTKQISHATSISQYLNENFYCKNYLRVFFYHDRKTGSKVINIDGKRRQV